MLTSSIFPHRPRAGLALRAEMHEAMGAKNIASYNNPPSIMR